jgi:putative acetyltransferase
MFSRRARRGLFSIATDEGGEMREFPLIEVRPYQASDLDGVIDVFLRAVREIASDDYNSKQISAWAQVDREEWAAARMSRPTWVAVSNGKIAGFIDLHMNGLIDMLFVNPDFARKGVATSLLARVEAEAGEADVRVLHTYASITAHSFFEKCGFTMLLARNVSVRGEKFIQCVMEKIL